MQDTADVTCPYCLEQVEVFIDPDTVGDVVIDCDVCCRPWAIRVARDTEGDLDLQVSRAQ